MNGCFVNRGWEEVDLISCQLCPHCTNLLDWQDSMIACVVMYVFSLVTQGMGFRRVHTQLAKKAVVMCRWTDVDGQMDGLW